MVPFKANRIIRSRWGALICIGGVLGALWYLVPTEEDQRGAAEIAAIARSQGLSQ